MDLRLTVHVRAVAQVGDGARHPGFDELLRRLDVNVPQLEAFTGYLYGAGKGEGHVDYPHWLAMAWAMPGNVLDLAWPLCFTA